MINGESMIWHYLGSFILYTGIIIGMIYLVYFTIRKGPAGLLQQFTQGKKQSTIQGLHVESTLNLEPRKTLYVVRSGAERFLLASQPEATVLLSKLANDETILSSESYTFSEPVDMPAHFNTVEPPVREIKREREKSPTFLGALQEKRQWVPNHYVNRATEHHQPAPSAIEEVKKHEEMKNSVLEHPAAKAKAVGNNDEGWIYPEQAGIVLESRTMNKAKRAKLTAVNP